MPSRNRLELAEGIVSKACTLAADNKKPLAGSAFDAVKWLATPPNVRDEHLATIARLSASVFVGARFSSQAPDVEKLLSQLPGGPLPHKTCVSFTKQVLEKVDTLVSDEYKSARVLLRAALDWLSEKSAKDAADMWCSLLAPRNGAPSGSSEAEVSINDVKNLLCLCETFNVELPYFEAEIAKTLYGEVLKVFVESPMPEARAVALQTLELKQLGSQEMALVDQLSADPCDLIAIGAKHLKASLGGTEDIQHGVDSSCDSDSDSSLANKGYGKGKGKGKGKRVFECSDSDEIDGTDESDKDEEESDED